MVKHHVSNQEVTGFLFNSKAVQLWLCVMLCPSERHLVLFSSSRGHTFMSAVSSHFLKFMSDLLVDLKPPVSFVKELSLIR